MFGWKDKDQTKKDAWVCKKMCSMIKGNLKKPKPPKSPEFRALMEILDEALKGFNTFSTFGGGGGALKYLLFEGIPQFVF
jgi:hypothetical protein